MAKYLFSLNHDTGDDRFYFPRIDSDLMVDKRNKIVVGSDWHCGKHYDSGLYCLYNDSLIKLQDHPEANIVNQNKTFIYQWKNDGHDHRGIIAIEILSSHLLYFSARFDHYTKSVNLWFDVNASSEDIFNIIHFIEKKHSEYVCTVTADKDDPISITVDDYKKIVFDHLPLLIS